MTRSPVKASLLSMSSSRKVSAAWLFFADAATTKIYTLSLHDALPISIAAPPRRLIAPGGEAERGPAARSPTGRSEEHTSELQSLRHLVCRLLLEKKNGDVDRQLPVVRFLVVATADGLVQVAGGGRIDG